TTQEDDDQDAAVVPGVEDLRGHGQHLWNPGEASSTVRGFGLAASAARSEGSGLRPSRCAASPSTPPARETRLAAATEVRGIDPSASDTASLRGQSSVPVQASATSGVPSGVGYWNGDCPMDLSASSSGGPPSVRAPVVRSAEATSWNGRFSLLLRASGARKA